MTKTKAVCWFQKKSFENLSVRLTLYRWCYLVRKCWGGCQWMGAVHTSLSDDTRGRESSTCLSLSHLYQSFVLLSLYFFFFFNFQWLNSSRNLIPLIIFLPFQYSWLRLPLVIYIPKPWNFLIEYILIVIFTGLMSFLYHRFI